MKNSLLGDLEQKIMNIVWNSDVALRPKEVNKKLRVEYSYSTVVTVLTRLYRKGILDRSKIGKVYQYTARKSREQYASSRLKKLFKGLISNYGELAVSQFIDSIGDNPADLQNLETYLRNRINENK